MLDASDAHCHGSFSVHLRVRLHHNMNPRATPGTCAVEVTCTMAEVRVISVFMLVDEFGAPCEQGMCFGMSCLATTMTNVFICACQDVAGVLNAGSCHT